MNFLRHFLIFFVLVVFITPLAYSEDNQTNQTKIEDYIKIIQKTINDSNARLSNELIDNISNGFDKKLADLKHQVESLKMEFDSDKKAKETLKDNARIVYNKALELVTASKMKEAGFYFAAAALSDPSEKAYIGGYVSAVLTWADTMLAGNKPESALQTLYDMELFLYSYVQGPAVINADYILMLSDKVSAKIDEARSASTYKSTNYDTLSLNSTLKNSLILLNTEIPDNITKTEEYKSKLEGLITQLLKLSEKTSKDEIKNTINELSERLKNVSVNLEVNKYLKRGNDLLTLAKNQTNMPFASQLIAEAALTGQKLSIISEDVSPILKKQIDQYNTEFIKVSGTIAKSVSMLQFQTLQNKFDTLMKRLSKNDTNAERAQSLLLDLQDEVIVESSKITDPEYLKLTRKFLLSINNELESWRQIQLRRYEGWTVKTLQRFNDTYSGEIGLLSSGSDTKERIYNGMKDYLCAIDVNYLGHASSTIYADVFDLFYKELNRDQRLKLSVEFVNCDKKKLKDF